MSCPALTRASVTVAPDLDMAVRGTRKIKAFGNPEVYILGGQTRRDRGRPGRSGQVLRRGHGRVRVASGLDGVESERVSVVSGMLEQIGGPKRKRLISPRADRSYGSVVGGSRV